MTTMINWAAKGEADGREEARALHEARPLPEIKSLTLQDWIRKTDGVEAGREEGWDEGARQAGTAEIVGCPAQHRDEYYAGYARGGLAEAWEIRREIEAAAQSRLSASEEA